jgi:hypothetical protein
MSEEAYLMEKHLKEAGFIQEVEKSLQPKVQIINHSPVKQNTGSQSNIIQ